MTDKYIGDTTTPLYATTTLVGSREVYRVYKDEDIEWTRLDERCSYCSTLLRLDDKTVHCNSCGAPA